jgi:hypothetical protein
MEMEHLAICPWCDTEIVWDGEIGPEEHCPHCYSELGAYRSIQISLQDEEDDEQLPQKLKSEDLLDDQVWEGKDDVIYTENIQKLVSAQKETLECNHCFEFLLYMGVESTQAENFTSATAKLLEKDVVYAPMDMDVYVCPTCFKVEKYISVQSRVKWMSQFTKE